MVPNSSAILILQFRPNGSAHHVVPSWKKGNAGDVVIVAVQSLQALVGVEVPELHRHVRAAACEHFTLLVQTHVLKIKNFTFHFDFVTLSLQPLLTHMITPCFKNIYHIAALGRLVLYQTY